MTVTTTADLTLSIQTAGDLLSKNKGTVKSQVTYQLNEIPDKLEI